MKTKQLVFAVVGLAFALIVGSAILVFSLVPGYIEREVKRQAAERGVELEIGSLDWGWEWVKLRDTRARLTGVSSLLLHFDTVDTELDGRELVELGLEGVTATAQGPLPLVALELGAWSKRFPNTYELPLAATGISLTWRPDAGTEPWLALSGGAVTKTPASTTFVAEKARAAGADLGRVGATVSASASSVALGFGETELAKAPLRIDAEQSPAPKVTLTLAPVPLERMAGPFAMELPVKDVIGSGVVRFDFAARESMVPSAGHARLELRGYVPPHPVELDGFVFGDVTVFETDFRVGESLDDVVLENTSVTAGKFVLKGSGDVTREPKGARIRLDLRGALPCDALASAAAESRLGRLLGRTAGKKAGIATFRVVGGSVAVRVQVDANTANLPDARVTRSIGVGCGLKPLTLEDLRRLGEELFQGDLSRLPEELGKLLPPGPLPIPSRLPPLPSALPSSFEIRLPIPPLRPAADAGTRSPSDAGARPRATRDGG